MVQPPFQGQRILIYKPGAIDQILAGTKTMDLRPVHYKPGVYLLGCKGIIHASARLGPAIPMDSPLQLERYRHRHRHPFGEVKKLPYETTWAFPINDVNRLHIAFRHPQGAVNLVRDRKP